MLGQRIQYKPHPLASRLVANQVTVYALMDNSGVKHWHRFIQEQTVFER